MTNETKFKALNRHQKFQFLFLCAKANEQHTIKWIKKNFKVGNTTEAGYDITIINALDFLKKLLFPHVDDTIIKDKEIMLNGLADDILTLLEKFSDIKLKSHGLKALASLKSLEELYTVLMDCFFGPVDFDLDHAAFQVILLASLGAHVYDTYKMLAPYITHSISWEDLPILNHVNREIQRILNEFMDQIFTQFMV